MSAMFRACRGLEAQSYQQGGYFTAAQARTHGASRQLIEHHVRRGRFERVGALAG